MKIERAIEIIREDFKYSLGNTPLVNDVLNLAISALEKQKKILDFRDLVWGMDIPSPTCPEYVEHHRDIQKILKFIYEELLMDK